MSIIQKYRKINIFQKNKKQKLTKIEKLKLVKIQEEYQKAFEIVAICPKIRATFYGGARVKTTSLDFINIQKLAQNLAELGVGIASGGGTGIMEASLLGAQNALENWKKNQETGNSIFQNLNQNPNQKFSKSPVIQQKIQQNNLENSARNSKNKIRNFKKLNFFGEIKKTENWQNLENTQKVTENTNWQNIKNVKIKSNLKQNMTKNSLQIAIKTEAEKTKNCQTKIEPKLKTELQNEYLVQNNFQNWQDKNQKSETKMKIWGKTNFENQQNYFPKKKLEIGIGIGFRMNIISEIPTVRGQIDTLFTDFGPRKWALRSSQVWIFAPGGFGTLDELMENLTLFKLARTEKKLIFLYNSKFWSGLLDWLKSEVCGGFLADNFENYFILTDSIDEILSRVQTIL